MKRELTVDAPAKINLFLDITGKRTDGYHTLCSIMQTVSIYDTVLLQPSAQVRLHCAQKGIPRGKGNLAYDAAQAFVQKAKVPGADITLIKRIPSGAGLGGGSSDAAAVLRGLNQLYDYPLSDKLLYEMALQLGTDVPFFLRGGCALVEGIGEKLTTLTPFMDCAIVIVKPKFGISTVQAYRKYDAQDAPFSLDVPTLLATKQAEDLPAFCAQIGNALSQAVACPPLRQLEQRLLELGAVGSCMTGSGSAVFGLFLQDEKAERAQEVLQRDVDFCSLCRPCCI